MHKFLITLLLLLSANAFAVNTYNAATNTLTLDSVNVGGTQYNNVALQLTGFNVLSIGSSSPTTTTATIVDSYDPASNTLSIPYIMVGKNIYTNVVLQEYSFNVLRYDPYPSVGQVIGGILYTFNGCYIQGSVLTCNLQLTSQNQSRTSTIWMCGNSFGLTDNKGNIYNPSSIQIGNQSTTYCNYNNFPFAANVTTAAQIIFTNVATNATAIANLGLRDGNNNTITFTNSPFINSAPPNPF